MNKKLEKLIAVTLIPSVLAPSCTSNDYFDDLDVASINSRSLSDIGSVTVPITLNFDSRDGRILNFMVRICADIVKNPVIAKQFAKNPTALAESYGVTDLQIDFDDELWKLVVALGDEDIHNAIINNDISNFLRLCKEKGLITEITKSDLLKYQSMIENIDEGDIQMVGNATL
jgi:hypothetical protein